MSNIKNGKMVERNVWVYSGNQNSKKSKDTRQLVSCTLLPHQVLNSVRNSGPLPIMSCSCEKRYQALSKFATCPGKAGQMEVCVTVYYLMHITSTFQPPPSDLLQVTTTLQTKTCTIVFQGCSIFSCLGFPWWDLTSVAS